MDRRANFNRWFTSSWSHLKKKNIMLSFHCLTQHLMDKHIFPPYINQSILFYLGVMWNVHAAHCRAWLHLALNRGGPSTPSLAKSAMVSQQLNSSVYNHVRTTAATETAPNCPGNYLYWNLRRELISLLWHFIYFYFLQSNKCPMGKLCCCQALYNMK